MKHEHKLEGAEYTHHSMTKHDMLTHCIVSLVVQGRSCWHRVDMEEVGAKALGCQELLTWLGHQAGRPYTPTHFRQQ